jgi:enoyl-CoA hydratase/carnithine racemase
MTIKTRTENDVAFVEIARPERKNALTVEMYGQLADAFGGAGQDASVRAIVLHGSPEVFCAGNDLQDFLQRPADLAESPAARFMRALAAAEKPVVAAVNGAAVGIGTTLLMHCDLAYCADNAMFSMPFVALGICPEFSSSLLLPLNAGYHRAAEKLLLSEPISAEEALEMGLVNRILPPGEVLDYATRQARRFSALPPASVRETKRLLKAGWRSAVEQAMAEEGRVFAKLLHSDEAREAIGAFLERRKPDFSRFG